MSTHGPVRDLLPLFALGALEGTEECEMVCAHLATGCPSCAEELAAYARTAAAIPAALPPAMPRPAARDALAKKLAATPRAVPSNVLEVEFPAKKKAPAGGRATWPLALAASIAIVAVVYGVRAQDKLRRETTQRFALEKSVLTYEQKVAELEKTNRQLDDDMKGLATVLASPDTKVFPIGPAGKDETGAGRIVEDGKGHKWMLFARGLPELPQGKKYELWFIAENKAVPGGLEKIAGGKFEKDAASGLYRLDSAMPAGRTDLKIGAITEEPENDPEPDKPNGRIVLLGKQTA